MIILIENMIVHSFTIDYFTNITACFQFRWVNIATRVQIFLIMSIMSQSAFRQIKIMKSTLYSITVESQTHYKRDFELPCLLKFFLIKKIYVKYKRCNLYIFLFV